MPTPFSYRVTVFGNNLCQNFFWARFQYRFDIFATNHHVTIDIANNDVMIMTNAIAIARTVANDDATATVANAPPNAISTAVAAAIAVITAVAAVTAVVNPIPAVTTVVATEATATAATTAFL